MSELNFKPEAAAERVGEKTLAVPAFTSDAPSHPGTRLGTGTHGLRRRFNATRLHVDDGGFRLFRVY